MKNFAGYMLIMLIFFIAATAFMEVDRRCSDMYGTGGRILEEAAEVAGAAARLWSGQDHKNVEIFAIML